ncbi:glycoside hydrolase family 88 protein [Paenibacillaceae bacterium WGS1546]|uniref:glycoside hydrolase family 88 protein n=1 Tax=Cohnella sp. WGS1546 TaxID=3366810 RepID=UPI00372D1B65
MDYVQALDRSFRKAEEISKSLADFPHITRDGEWLTHANGHWTGGFWTGLHWLRSFHDDRPETIREYAGSWSKRFRSRIGDNKTHDMGFIFGPSCVLGDRIRPDSELRELALHGAKNMRDLYEERSGLILAWDEPGYEGNAIVDTIMNLPLMVWASGQTGNAEYARIAQRVADRIWNVHVRPDHSIYHLVKWDPETFEIVEKTTHQGYKPETCWSRGQSWALYGFANMARYTGNLQYLDASRKIAEYFWSNLDSELRLPRWDFAFRDDPREPLDASAGSIASSGMLLLADRLRLSGNEREAGLWQERGEAVVNALIRHCLYQDIAKYGIIEHATVDKPRQSGIDESTMYGDYYFVEALFRIAHRNDRETLDLLY